MTTTATNNDDQRSHQLHPRRAWACFHESLPYAWRCACFCTAVALPASRSWAIDVMHLDPLFFFARGNSCEDCAKCLPMPRCAIGASPMANRGQFYVMGSQRRWNVCKLKSTAITININNGFNNKSSNTG